MKKDKTIVLFSGGQDSTTCLFWAKTKFKEVLALNIGYGQRHSIETKAAKKITELAEVSYREFTTDLFLQIGDSTLIGKGNISASHRQGDNLPASFVPGRNIIFLTVAAAYAYKHNIKNVITGVCQADYSGYYDCRDKTIKSLQETLSLGLNYPLKIHTPLMYLSKAKSIKLALSLPGCMEALAYSHTCYEGKVPPCGKCPACVLRAKGFLEAGIVDPLILRLEKENIK